MISPACPGAKEVVTRTILEASHLPEGALQVQTGSSPNPTQAAKLQARPLTKYTRRIIRRTFHLSAESCALFAQHGEADLLPRSTLRGARS
jgi:hypothetical protein